MFADTSERYTIRVSPELRFLRGQLAPRPVRPGPDAPEPDVAEVRQILPRGIEQAGPAQGEPPGCTGSIIRLRRDGCRPLVFEGALLVRFSARSDLGSPEGQWPGRPAGNEDHQTPGAPRSSIRSTGVEKALREPGETGLAADGGEADREAEQLLELFISSDGRLFAQMRFLPPAGFAARPIHKAAELFSREDLSRFIASHRPEEAFCIGAPNTGVGTRRLDTALISLRAAFARMTAPLRNSFGETVT